MAPEQFADAKNVPTPGATSTRSGRPCTDRGHRPAPVRREVRLAGHPVEEGEGDIPSARRAGPVAQRTGGRRDPPGVHPDPASRPASCLEFFKLLTARKAARTATPDRAAGGQVRAAGRPPGLRPPRGRDRDQLRAIDRRCAAGRTSCGRWSSGTCRPAGSGCCWLGGSSPGRAVDRAVGRPGHDAAEAAGQVVRVTAEPLGHWAHGCAFQPG